jgi:hypothetical protein
MPSRKPKPAVARRVDALVVAEWVTAIILSVAAVWLLAVHITNAVALWRDEASTVFLATLPSWGAVWAALPFDHCPPLVHVLIRTWSAFGLADNDSSLRMLGLLIGVLLVGAVWAASHFMGRRTPVLALSLIGLNSTVLTTVDSFRGYGVGCVTAVLMIVAVWRLASAPSARTTAVAAIAAVLSVQALYQNAIFVAAACVGGLAACLLTKNRRAMWLTLAVGAMAAVSMLPYLPIIRHAQDWYLLEKSGLTLSWAWQKAAAAAGTSSPAWIWMWVALCLGALAYAGQTVVARASERAALSAYSAVAMLTAMAGFVVFLANADLPTQPWYYVPVLVFVAVCLDALLVSPSKWMRLGLLSFAAVIVLTAGPTALDAANVKRTNLDSTAAQLAAHADPQDLILVHPWYCAATISRYFKGSTPWTTVPPLSDNPLHRYDLVKVEMQKAEPLRPVFDRITSTLQSGHKVWIVGGIPLDGTAPIETRPAPNSPWGWLDSQYSIAWGSQVGAFLLSHAEHGVLVAEPAATGVDPLENLPVYYVVGWKTIPPPVGRP